MRKSLRIDNGDFWVVEKYVEEREETLKNWKEKIEGIYKMSANATMLKGEKLKAFYLYLVKNEGKSKYFRYLCLESVLDEIKKKIKPPAGSSPFECLEVIFQFFTHLKTEEEKYQAKDRDEQYVTIVTIS